MKTRVLIADDQPDVLEALRLVFKAEGYETHSASSPAAVLQKLETQDFDAALIDAVDALLAPAGGRP